MNATPVIKLPRTIKIVLHDARNLEYRVPHSKSTSDTRKWRAIFIGGEKKQATSIVDAQDGFPCWDCEVTISTRKPVDSVYIRVVDGKERHIGQVMLPLLEMLQTKAPPLIASGLEVRSLGPTRKNSYPCGQISYWCWVEAFWPEGTQIQQASGKTHNSIKQSLSKLGHGIKKRSILGGRGSSEQTERSSPSSSLPKPSIAGSMLAVQRSVSDLADWPSEQSDSRQQPGLQHRYGGSASFNPFDADDSEAESRTTFATPDLIRQTKPYSSGPSTSANNQKAPSPKKANGGSRSRKLINKCKEKLSHSTSNLNAKMKPSPAANKFHKPTTSGSDFALHEPYKVSSNVSMEGVNRLEKSMGSSYPVSSKSQQKLDSISSSKVELPHMQNNGNRGLSGSIDFEQLSDKNLDEMNKREIIEYTTKLLQHLQQMHSEALRVGLQNRRLLDDVSRLESDLDWARKQLTHLQNRLLSDHLTVYLEINGSCTSTKLTSDPRRSDPVSPLRSHNISNAFN